MQWKSPCRHPHSHFGPQKSILQLTSRAEDLESMLATIHDYVEKVTAANVTETPLVVDRKNPGTVTDILQGVLKQQFTIQHGARASLIHLKNLRGKIKCLLLKLESFPYM